MRIAEYIRPELSWIVEQPVSRDEILSQIAERMSNASDQVEFELLYTALLKREEKGSTATPEGVAFPHAMLPEVKQSLIAVALVPAGVDFERKGAPNSDIVIALVGPQDRAWEHLRLLARVARICHADGLDRLRKASSSEDLYQRLVREDESHA